MHWPRPYPSSSSVLRVRAVTHLTALATGCFGTNILRLLPTTSRHGSKQHGKQHSQGLMLTHQQPQQQVATNWTININGRYCAHSLAAQEYGLPGRHLQVCCCSCHSALCFDDWELPPKPSATTLSKQKHSVAKFSRQKRHDFIGKLLESVKLLLCAPGNVPGAVQPQAAQSCEHRYVHQTA